MDKGTLIVNGRNLSGGGANNAKDILFDKTDTGLSANNVQDAISEVKQDLTHIVGGDEWVQRTYNEGEACIDDNKAWLCIATTTTRPSASDTTHWKQMSLKDFILKDSVEVWEDITSQCTFHSNIASTNLKVKYNKVLKVVRITGYVTLTNSVSGTLITLPKISDGYQYCAGMNCNTSDTYTLLYSSNSLKLDADGSIPKMSYFCFARSDFYIQ